MTPSNSSSSINHLAQHHHHYNSPEFFQLTNNATNKLTDTSLLRQPSFNNKPLLDRLPSFDNSGLNLYSSLGHPNTTSTSNMTLVNNFDHSINTASLPPSNSSFFNHNNANKKNGLPGVCNISTNTTVMNDRNMYPGHFNNINNSTQCQQQSAYVQTNNIQPLLSQPNTYQSPLLPHPPAQYAMQQPQQQHHRQNEFLSQYNQMNRFPRYTGSNSSQQYNNNQRSSNYSKNYSANQQHRRSGNGTYQSGGVGCKPTGAKSSSPPKPVQKITILPKPKNAPTATTETAGKTADEGFKK